MSTDYDADTTRNSLAIIAEEMVQFNKKLEKGLELLESMAAKVTIEKIQAVGDALTEMIDAFIPENIKE